MGIPKRLQEVLSLVPTCHTIADVGTDHGQLAVALIKEGKAKRVIATDVHKGPLEAAKRTVQDCGLSQYIDCRLGDGLETTGLGEVDCAVICGMGGFLMRHIIEGAPGKVPTYVLQPQNGQVELRQYLVSHGYKIVKEVPIKEGRHWYEAWVVVQGRDTVYRERPLSSILWEVGALLVASSHPLRDDFLRWHLRKRQAIMDSLPATIRDFADTHWMEVMRSIDKVERHVAGLSFWEPSSYGLTDTMVTMAEASDKKDWLDEKVLAVYIKARQEKDVLEAFYERYTS